ncbi:MAG TPA: AAA family ATPase [Acidimicrobiales bacterium]|nr:AAA family ATPase [Acidimicrobiales bacterium]
MVTSPFVLQMAGWMGTGKSTIASAVRSATGAVVLDHDTTKSAIIRAGFADGPAGAASYEVLFDLTHDFLDQGHAVIIDSPSAYVSIPARGMALAAAAAVPYYFVECVCSDAVSSERLELRKSRPSQVKSAEHAAAVRASVLRQPHRPLQGALRLDTTGSVDDCVALVLEYLESEGATGGVLSEGRS